MDSLSDASVECIATHLAGDVQDLLRFSRTSTRYHRAVSQSEEVWKRAYKVAYGDSPSTSETRPGWHGRFKARFLAEAVSRRQRSAAKRLKLTSTSHSLGQDIHRLQRRLEAERRALASIRDELRTVHCALHEHRMQGYWQPVAVTRATGTMVTQLPLNAQSRKQHLSMQEAIARLEVEKLGKMLGSKEKALKSTENKLKSLQP